MDIGTISQLIGGLGFPIVMCLLLNKDLKEERENHKKEVEQLSTVIQQNTEVLISLKERVSESE